MHTLFIVLLIIDCIALITVVLLQEGKSNGLSGAISGGDLVNSYLFLHRLTIILAVIFFLIMIGISYFGL